MPAASVLLAGGGVLGAHHRRAADLPARDALVAADALPDVVETALLDLVRQERVRDRRPGGADDVELSGVDDGDHRVGVRDPADADDRLVGVVARLDGARVRLLVVLLEEPGRAGVLPPLGDVADRQVPEVDEVVDVLDEAVAVLLELDAGRAVQRVDRESRGDRAVVTHGFAHLLEALTPEAGAVLERAPVLVRALVRPGGQELQRQVAVSTVDVDDVEAGRPGSDGTVDVVLLDRWMSSRSMVRGIDVGLELGGDLGRAAGRVPRLVARRMGAAVPELDPRRARRTGATGRTSPSGSGRHRRPRSEPTRGWCHRTRG